MTTVEKLGICGIRSYGTDKETVLKFQRPLTIILGQNGSGKSTIIESVKMATTGDFPPIVSQGAAFISDPRIRNAPETNAKIRLQFTNVRGEVYLVSRHFCLRVSSTGKQEFKTVDQTLKRNRKRRLRIGNGAGDDDDEENDQDRQQHSTSHRCTELNNILPDLLRVSKPILNSVIFVHQEDSLWPLADPRELKKRFDDIFAATRYTKALESIRKYRKEQSTELRVVHSELLRHEESAKVCEKLRFQADEIRRLESKLRAGVDVVQMQMSSIKAEQNRAKKMYVEFREVDQKRTVLEAHIGAKEGERASKYETLSENLVDLSDVELEKVIEDLEDGMLRAEGEKRDRASSLEHARNELEDLQRAFNADQNRKGVLETEARHQKTRLAELESMKRRLLTKLYPSAATQSVSISAPSADASLEEWTNSLQCVAEKCRTRVQDVTKSRRATEDSASASLSKVQATLTSREVLISQMKSDAASKRREANEKRQELIRGGDAVTSEIIDSAKADEASFHQTLSRFKDANRISEVSSSLSKAVQLLKSLRSDLEPKKRQRDALATDQRARIAVQYRKDELHAKTRSLSLATADFSGVIKDACIQLGLEGDPEMDVESGTADASGRVLRSRLFEVVDRLVSRRDRLHDQSNADLEAAALGLAEARTVETACRRSVSDTAKGLKALEKELQVLSSRRPKSMADLVGDEALLSSTVSRFTDGSGMTVLPLNLKAMQALDEKVGQRQKRASDHVASLSSTSGYIERAIAYFEERGSCMTCGHAGHDSVRNSQLRNMQALLESADTGKAAKWQQRLDDALECQEWTSVAMRLGERIISARDDHSKASRELADQSKKCSDAKRMNAEVEKKRKAVMEKFGSLTAYADAVSRRDEVSRLVDDEKKAQRVYEDAKLTLPAESASRSVEDVDREIRELESKLRRAQDEVEEQRGELDSLREEYRRLLEVYNRAKERVMVLERDIQKQRQLEAEKNELLRLSRELDANAVTEDHALVKLHADVEKEQEELACVRAESAHEIESCTRLVTQCDNAMASWFVHSNAAESYSKSSKSSELARLERHMKATREQIHRLATDVKQHTREVEGAGESLREKSGELQNAISNRSFRQLQKELQMKQGQVREMRLDLERLTNESTRRASELLAASDQQRIDRQQALQGSHAVDNHEEDHGISTAGVEDANERNWGGKKSISRLTPADLVNELSRQYNRLNGLLHATEGKAQGYTERWKAKQDEIREADRMGSMKKYEQCRITKQTIELASSDLDRYHKALDQALMSYHALKMDNINKTVRELWQATYRGNDIDEIQIVSDAGEGGNTTAAGAKRNYNYRVAMRRGDARLDMRGRCSAGQKVLACLVIRLALAESFCAECGVLALDEPTTNLDRDNVESLASALRSLIESRRKQAHFQLILISHDQEFLSMMSARSYCDKYLVVYKDAGGFSNVKEQDIRTLED